MATLRNGHLKVKLKMMFDLVELLSIIKFGVNWSFDIAQYQSALKMFLDI